MTVINEPTGNYLEPLCYQMPTYNFPQSFVVKDSDDADETLPVVGPPELRVKSRPSQHGPATSGPINAASSKGGGVAMLRDLVYADILGRRGNESTAREWGAMAAQFEQVCGYKKQYTREDLTFFLAYLRKKGLCQNTIFKYLKPLKVLAQIQEWDFPKLTMRRVSIQEVKRPAFGKDEVISLIQNGKRLCSPPQLCFLALSTIYGIRRVEMERVNPADLSDETITVNTAKEGPQTTHLVPPEIAPYLQGFKFYKADSLTHMFHQIMVATGLNATGGFGWHSIRRALTTELILSEASTLNVARFMRWSETTVRREFGMPSLYAAKDQPRIDEQIFAIHPFLPYWGTGEPRQTRSPQKLQPLIDLINSGNLDAEDIEQMLTMLKQRELRN